MNHVTVNSCDPAHGHAVPVDIVIGDPDAYHLALHAVQNADGPIVIDLDWDEGVMLTTPGPAPDGHEPDEDGEAWKSSDNTSWHWYVMFVPLRHITVIRWRRR